jgi:hypothetical protein
LFAFVVVLLLVFLFVILAAHDLATRGLHRGCKRCGRSCHRLFVILLLFFLTVLSGHRASTS